MQKCRNKKLEKLGQQSPSRCTKERGRGEGGVFQENSNKSSSSSLSAKKQKASSSTKQSKVRQASRFTHRLVLIVIMTHIIHIDEKSLYLIANGVGLSNHLFLVLNLIVLSTLNPQLADQGLIYLLFILILELMLAYFETNAILANTSSILFVFVIVVLFVEFEVLIIVQDTQQRGNTKQVRVQVIELDCFGPTFKVKNEKRPALARPRGKVTGKNKALDQFNDREN